MLIANGSFALFGAAVPRSRNSQEKLDVDEFGSSRHDFLVASPLSMPHLPMYFNALVVQMWMPILLHTKPRRREPTYLGMIFAAFAQNPDLENVGVCRNDSCQATLL